MSEQSVQTAPLPTLFAKPLVVAFETPQQSLDGGAILLKAVDDRFGLTARLAACLPKWRHVGKVGHDLPALIRQRCFGLACGYPDANDSARLKDDPIHKFLVGIRDVSYGFYYITLETTMFDLKTNNPLWSAYTSTKYEDHPLKKIGPFTSTIMNELDKAKLLPGR